jgi:hypothetical protein
MKKYFREKTINVETVYVSGSVATKLGLYQGVSGCIRVYQALYQGQLPRNRLYQGYPLYIVYRNYAYTF